MIDLYTLAVKPGTEEIFNRSFDDRDRRKDVANALYTWLLTKARKKQVPDLQHRLEVMRKRIDLMVEDMEIRFEKDKPVVKVTGSSENTLKILRLGSDWFTGTEDVLELVVTGLFDK